MAVAEALLELALRTALAGARLTAVAPGGAPADALGLEQHHVGAARGEVQRGGEPGVAAPDHADAGARLAVQRGELRSLVRGGGVIRGHVAGGAHRQLLPGGGLLLPEPLLKLNKSSI